MHLLQYDNMNNTAEKAICRDLTQQIIMIRHNLNISQTELATKLCISVRTLESWERGVRYPSSSAQALLRLFIKSPQFVLDNLS